MKNQWFSLKSNLLLVIACICWGLIGCSVPRNIELRQDFTVKSVYTKKAAFSNGGEHQPVLQMVASESSRSDRPNWTKKTAFQEGNNLYFTGGFLNGVDYSLTIRCANAEALKIATQSISQYIRAVFSYYIQGPNTGAGGIERYVEDGIATFINNLHLQGILQKEVYFEEMFLGNSGPRYNVFVMLEISKADYLKAKAGALRKMKDEFERNGQTEAKKKAEELLEELKKEVNKERAKRTMNDA